MFSVVPSAYLAVAVYVIFPAFVQVAPSVFSSTVTSAVSTCVGSFSHTLVAVADLWSSAHSHFVSPYLWPSLSILISVLSVRVPTTLLPSALFTVAVAIHTSTPSSSQVADLLFSASFLASTVICSAFGSSSQTVHFTFLTVASYSSVSFPSASFFLDHSNSPVY